MEITPKNDPSANIQQIKSTSPDAFHKDLENKACFTRELKQAISLKHTKYIYVFNTGPIQLNERLASNVIKIQEKKI